MMNLKKICLQLMKNLFDESTVNLELEKYNKLLNSDNMKLVMKKD